MLVQINLLLLSLLQLLIQPIASFSIHQANIQQQTTNPTLKAATDTDTDTTTDTNNANDIQTAPTLIPPNILGPPKPLHDLKIGDTLNAFRNSNGFQKSTNFTIQRISYTPDAFVLKNYLTEFECDQIQTTAEKSNMTHAETITENDTSSRKNCDVAWLPSSSSSSDTKHPNIVSGLVSSTANLLLSQSVLGHPSAGVEDLQVLKYDVGGEFVLHHDGEPRVLTVIYYVNGVGGTWFPLARTSNDINDDPCSDMDTSTMEERFMSSRNDAKVNDKVNINRNSKTTPMQPQNKAQAMDLGKDLKPGYDGILVKGLGVNSTSTLHTQQQQNGNQRNQKQLVDNNDNDNPHVAWIGKGDALAFYNYCDDGSARLDWRSLHCGLPTTEQDGVKWIANHWFRVNDLADYE